MSGEGFPSEGHGAAHRPALAAVADDAEPDRTHPRDSESLVERVNAYGYHAPVVSLHAAENTTSRPAA